MEIVYVLLPLSLLLAVCGLAAWFWAVRTGQFEDLDTPPLRVLMRDEKDEKEGKKTGRHEDGE